MRGMLTRTSDYGPAGTPSIEPRYAQIVYLTAPAAVSIVSRADRQPSRAAASPDGRPRPAPGCRAVSIWGWLKLTIAIWLFRQALKLTGWLLAAGVAVAAWPITVVAAVGVWGGVAAGLAPGPAVAGGRWSLPMTAVYVTGQALRLRSWPAVALAPVSDWADAWRLLAAPRDPARRAAGGPGRGPGRAGARRPGVGVADLRHHHRPGRADRLRAGLVRRPPVAPPGPVRPGPGRRPRRGAAADRPGPGRGRGDHPGGRAPVAARPGRPGGVADPPFGDHRLVRVAGRRT